MNLMYIEGTSHRQPIDPCRVSVSVRNSPIPHMRLSTSSHNGCRRLFYLVTVSDMNGPNFHRAPRSRSRPPSSSIIMIKRKRALEACDSCRKQKTRCLSGPADDENRSCLRCRSLQLKILEKAIHTISASSQLNKNTWNSDDIIVNGLLCMDEIELLLDIFIERYGRRWLSIEMTSTEYFEQLYPKSPLMLATACLTALRHSQALKARVYVQLLDLVDRLVAQELLTSAPSLHFFEAVSILTLYSPLRFAQRHDLWLLSGFALQHRVLSSTRGWFNGFVGSSATLTYLDIVPARTWNQMCHGHLTLCIGYRRHAMLDENNFDQCRTILSNCKANEFDGNILGMLALYSMLYRFLRSDFDLDYAIFQLEEWKKEWSHLWKQPEPEYSQIAYYYAYNVVYEACIQIALQSKDSSTVPHYASMVENYAVKTIGAVMGLSAYDMSRCSDHVLFHGAFACASLLRLVHAANCKAPGSSAIDGESLNAIVTKCWKWLVLISVDEWHLANKFANYVKQYQDTVNNGTQSSRWFKGPSNPVSESTALALKPYILSVATVERS
ncbi:transcription factor [Schizosaccharomyces japonicus yFS275]|uniref:Transcription factor n=1 Tax=Schizosaccharomyces japonicus (strain yFS275 / FY16936) TaxID=402676 RepID=B6K7J8_SCHJY|nr:transcription factor [Schizosaccharomyces japonicus yFS275]EEB09502.1 transcription factor [Schizosaccharomyces japonicus yFS275]